LASGWRIYQSVFPGRRFVGRRQRGRRDLKPLEWVVLERRQVGEWAEVDE
jgi:hypothetical protein